MISVSASELDVAFIFFATTDNSLLVSLVRKKVYLFISLGSTILCFKILLTFFISLSSISVDCSISKLTPSFSVRIYSHFHYIKKTQLGGR